MHLNDLAGRLGVEVRLERLEDGEGFQMRGGLCRLGGELVAIVDSRQSPLGRSRQLGRALAGLDLEGVFVRPVLREFFDQLKEVQKEEVDPWQGS
jgi:hypothetical protein